MEESQMVLVKVEVPAARDRTAIVTLNHGVHELARGTAAASVDAHIAAARGNADCDPLRAWGHPPAGEYRLANKRPAPADFADEYGGHLLLFVPQAGDALAAQAAGRVGLLVYGGGASADQRMRRTQGGLRLDNDMLVAVVEQAALEDEVTLTIEVQRAAAWWRVWSSASSTPPLSSSAVQAPPAPYDEMSLIEDLMQGVKSGVDTSGRIIAGAGLGVAALAAGAAVGAANSVRDDAAMRANHARTSTTTRTSY
jgi:hypothetical protein